MLKDFFLTLLGIGQVSTPKIAALSLASPLGARVDARVDASPRQARGGNLEDLLRQAAEYKDDRAAKLFEFLKSVSLVDAAPARDAGRPQRPVWNFDVAVREGLKSSTWVYACVFRLAQAAGSVTWYAERRDSKGEWRRDDAAPLSKLLNRPNPIWSGSQLIERIVYSLYLGGEGYITKLRATNGLPMELWAHTPRDVSPIPGKDALIAAFEFKASGKPARNVDARDVIQILFPDPSNNYRGLAPLEVAAAVVDSDSGAVEWNRNAIANRAVVDGVLTFKHDLSEEEHLAALAMLERSYVGAGNARRPIIVGNDAEFTAMSLTPVEMDFLNSRRMSREEICAVFGVPPVLVGILDSATYSNYATARDVFWLDTVVPLLNDLAEALTTGLAAEFGPDWRVAYDTSSIAALHKIGADRISAATALHKIGVPLAVLNDRFRLGLPTCPDDAVAFVNGTPTQVLLGGGAASQAAPEASATRQQLEAARELVDATRAILARAQRGEASDEDLDVVDELEAELSALLAALRG